MTTSALKVCHLISGDLLAGAEVQLHSTLVALAANPALDLRVIVLNEGLLAERLRADKLRVEIVSERDYRFFALLSRLSEILKENPPTILHTHRYKENILAALLKRRGLANHLVQTIHGTKEFYRGINNIKMMLYRSADNLMTKRYFDKVIAVSNEIAKNWAGNVSSAALSTIHNAVSLDNVKADRSATEIKQELGIDASAQLIGSVGRLAPVKAYDIFLKGAAKVIRNRPNTHVLLIGDGPSRDSLEALAEQLGITANVHFLGFRPEIYDMIAALDIFVLSSLHEGISIALLEAMALETPVVATNVGGSPEIIEDNKSGILVPPADSEKLGEVCINLLSKPQLCSSLAKDAKLRIKQRFSLPAQTTKLIELYQSLLAEDKVH